MKLELSFKHKGQKRYFYGNTIEEVALDSYNEYFQNDEGAYEYIPNEYTPNYDYEDYIKEFLNGELKYVGDDVVYLNDVYYVCDFTFFELKRFLETLTKDIRKHIKKDAFNDKLYIQADNVDEIVEELERLGEDF